MLKPFASVFGNARGRRIVATEFLRLGLRIDGNGKIYVGNIEVSPAKVGRALNVDRRVVIETAKAIANDDRLLQVFYRLESRAFIGNAARELGFDTVEIRADPRKKGIVASVTRVLAENGIVIRQIISDDPDIFPDPVLTIIINGKLDAGVIKKLKELRFATQILIK
ncbi:MAG: amino acid-binding protein [Candidatus Marsarchaeota archaeon]|jgi:predicted regulator of amino acid metabolism with ACT domain|nr:amino acid-binding protein [Candidatus Marsarchaeota archaeon]